MDLKKKIIEEKINLLWISELGWLELKVILKKICIASGMNPGYQVKVFKIWLIEIWNGL